MKRQPHAHSWVVPQFSRACRSSRLECRRSAKTQIFDAFAENVHQKRPFTRQIAADTIRLNAQERM